MRGIAYMQVPTTFLAQVDSSVGGKTGVNLPEGKNLVGCFYQPQAVFADVSVLGTLPDRELRAGLMESIKAGIIRDRALVRFLEEHGSKLPWHRLVSPSLPIEAIAEAVALARSGRWPRVSVRPR